MYDTAPVSLRQVRPDDWPDLIGLFADASYEQSLTYGRAAAARIGADAEFISVEREGRPVGAACIRIKRVPGLGRGIAWIAAGPLIVPLNGPAPSPAALQNILTALRDHVHAAGHVLRLRFPVVAEYDADVLAAITKAAGFRPTDRSPSYRTVVVNLSLDEDALLAGLHGKWRNPLRNALKSGLTLDHGPLDTYAPRFHRLYERVQRAKGFAPDIPPEFYYDLHGSDFAHEVLIAQADGEDVAGMTIGRTGPNAVYLFGSTDEPGRRLNAGHFLMWHSMLRAKSLGMRRLDLGGIDEADNPSVARYKLRTGGQDMTASGPWEARPSGLSARLIDLAETAHRRLRGRQ